MWKSYSSVWMISHKLGCCMHRPERPGNDRETVRREVPQSPTQPLSDGDYSNLKTLCCF